MRSLAAAVSGRQVIVIGRGESGRNVKILHVPANAAQWNPSVLQGSGLAKTHRLYRVDFLYSCTSNTDASKVKDGPLFQQSGFYVIPARL